MAIATYKPEDVRDLAVALCKLPKAEAAAALRQHASPIPRDFTALLWSLLPTSGAIEWSTFLLCGSTTPRPPDGEMEETRGVCGMVWRTGDTVYHCRTCGMDPSCAICHECFLNSDHEGHDYWMFSSGGGCCDCGDAEAWRPEGFCRNHCGAHGPASDEQILGGIEPFVLQVMEGVLGGWMRLMLDDGCAAPDKTRAVQWLTQLGACSLSWRRLAGTALTAAAGERGAPAELAAGASALAVAEGAPHPARASLLGHFLAVEVRMARAVREELHRLYFELMRDARFKRQLLCRIIEQYPAFVHQALDMHLSGDHMTADSAATAFGKFTVQFKGNMVVTMVEKGLLPMLLETLQAVLTRAQRADSRDAALEAAVAALVAETADGEFAGGGFDGGADGADGAGGAAGAEPGGLRAPSAAEHAAAAAALVVSADGGVVPPPTPPPPPPPVVDARSAVVRSHLYAQLCYDIRYALNHPPISRSLAESEALLSTLLRSLSMLEAMHPMVRATGAHVELEDSAWGDAFSLATEVTHLVPYVLAGIGAELPPGEHGRALGAQRHARMAGMTAGALAEWLRAVGALPDAAAALSAGARLAPSRARPGVSYHLPMHRLLAAIAGHGASSLDLELRELVPLPASVPRHAFFAAVLHFPLALQHVSAQKRALMWVRNGYAALKQSALYRSALFSDACLAPDVGCLQLCALELGFSRFLGAALAQWDLPPALRLGPGAPRAEPAAAVLLEDLLGTLVSVLRERSLTGDDAERAIERLLAHRLASCVAATHSELVNAVPRRAVEHEAFDAVLARLAEYSPPRGLQQGTFSARAAAWELFDPFYPHYSRPELHRALERWQQSVRAPGDPSALPLPAPPPPAARAFDGLRLAPRCALLHALLLRTLHGALRGCAHAPEGVTAAALRLLQECVFAEQLARHALPPRTGSATSTPMEVDGVAPGAAADDAAAPEPRTTRARAARGGAVAAADAADAAAPDDDEAEEPAALDPSERETSERAFGFALPSQRSLCANALARVQLDAPPAGLADDEPPAPPAAARAAPRPAHGAAAAPFGAAEFHAWRANALGGGAPEAVARLGGGAAAAERASASSLGPRHAAPPSPPAPPMSLLDVLCHLGTDESFGPHSNALRQLVLSLAQLDSAVYAAARARWPAALGLPAGAGACTDADAGAGGAAGAARSASPPRAPRGPGSAAGSPASPERALRKQRAHERKAAILAQFAQRQAQFTHAAGGPDGVPPPPPLATTASGMACDHLAPSEPTTPVRADAGRAHSAAGGAGGGAVCASASSPGTPVRAERGAGGAADALDELGGCGAKGAAGAALADEPAEPAVCVLCREEWHPPAAPEPGVACERSGGHAHSAELFGLLAYAQCAQPVGREASLPAVHAALGAARGGAPRAAAARDGGGAPHAEQQRAGAPSDRADEHAPGHAPAANPPARSRSHGSQPGADGGGADGGAGARAGGAGGAEHGSDSAEPHADAESEVFVRMEDLTGPHADEVMAHVFVVMQAQHEADRQAGRGAPGRAALGGGGADAGGAMLDADAADTDLDDDDDDVVEDDDDGEGLHGGGGGGAHAAHGDAPAHGRAGGGGGDGGARTDAPAALGARSAGVAAGRAGAPGARELGSGTAVDAGLGGGTHARWLTRGIGGPSALHVRFCGHQVHGRCLSRALVSLRPEGAALDEDEFTCPLCRRVCNALVPAHASSERPLPAAMAAPPPDERRPAGGAGGAAGAAGGDDAADGARAAHALGDAAAQGAGRARPPWLASAAAADSPPPAPRHAAPPPPQPSGLRSWLQRLASSGGAAQSAAAGARAEPHGARGTATLVATLRGVLAHHPAYTQHVFDPAAAEPPAAPPAPPRGGDGGGADAPAAHARAHAPGAHSAARGAAAATEDDDDVEMSAADDAPAAELLTAPTAGGVNGAPAGAARSAAGALALAAGACGQLEELEPTPLLLLAVATTVAGTMHGARAKAADAAGGSAAGAAPEPPLRVPRAQADGLCQLWEVALAAAAAEGADGGGGARRGGADGGGSALRAALDDALSPPAEWVAAGSGGPAPLGPAPLPLLDLEAVAASVCALALCAPPGPAQPEERTAVGAHARAARLRASLRVLHAAALVQAVLTIVCAGGEALDLRAASVPAWLQELLAECAGGLGLLQMRARADASAGAAPARELVSVVLGAIAARGGGWDSALRALTVRWLRCMYVLLHSAMPAEARLLARGGALGAPGGAHAAQPPQQPPQRAGGAPAEPEADVHAALAGIDAEYAMLSAALGLPSLDGVRNALGSRWAVVPRWLAALTAVRLRTEATHRASWCSRAIGLALPLAQPSPFVPLPTHYSELYNRHIHAKCSQCRRVPMQPAVCLLCGTLVCAGGSCCRSGGDDECTRHAAECGRGLCAYIVLKASTTLLCVGRRHAWWGSLYLDMHGEEDRGLTRGRPLLLNSQRVRAVRSLWESHGVREYLAQHPPPFPHLLLLRMRGRQPGP